MHFPPEIPVGPARRTRPRGRQHRVKIRAGGRTDVHSDWQGTQVARRGSEGAGEMKVRLSKRVSALTFYASRITHHVSRFTFYFSRLHSFSSGGRARKRTRRKWPRNC